MHRRWVVATVWLAVWASYASGAVIVDRVTGRRIAIGPPVAGSLEGGLRARVSWPGLSVSGRKAQALWAPVLAETCTRHGVEPALAEAVVLAESRWNPRAKSPKGACGLMQLIPATATRFGVEDVWDPVQNIDGGVRYLAYLLIRFAGDMRLAVAAYNAGEEAVERYGRAIPPFRETREYVSRVAQYYRMAQSQAGG